MATMTIVLQRVRVVFKRVTSSFGKKAKFILNKIKNLPWFKNTDSEKVKDTHSETSEKPDLPSSEEKTPDNI